MKVLCIGNSVLEITCPVNGGFKENDTLTLSEKYECGGGVAGNIAYLLKKWGAESYIASMLGADDAANKIKKEYETIGVKIDYIETSFDKGTSQNIILLNKTNKNSTILELNNSTFLKKYNFSCDPDIIVSDGYDYNATMAAFDRYGKAIKFLSLTSINNDALEIGKFVNYIIINKKTAELITNKVIDYNDSSSIVNIYNHLKQKFNAAEIIITLGERGSVYSINGQVKIMPPVRVEVVDTYGAGSVYVGAFIYAMGRNFGLEKSIAYATIAASLSTTKITGRESIPSLIEVSNYYDSKFGANNNPNNQNNINMNQQTSDMQKQVEVSNDVNQ